jgi:hypothetical protein
VGFDFLEQLKIGQRSPQGLGWRIEIIVGDEDCGLEFLKIDNIALVHRDTSIRRLGVHLRARSAASPVPFDPRGGGPSGRNRPGLENDFARVSPRFNELSVQANADRSRPGRLVRHSEAAPGDLDLEPVAPVAEREFHPGEVVGEDEPSARPGAKRSIRSFSPVLHGRLIEIGEPWATNETHDAARVYFADCTTHPDGVWITQQARNFAFHLDEPAQPPRFLIHAATPSSAVLSMRCL